jgi:hypothetical protein
MYHPLVLITARLEEGTVKELLDELLPARLLLDEAGEKGRWVELDRAQHVDFVAGEGLRVRTSGQLRWLAAGVPIGATLKSAQLMLRPVIADDEHGGRLVFRPSLEELDLKNIPGFLDSGVLSIVNGRLAAQGDELAWSFGKTLAVEIAMPASLVPLDKFRLTAGSGKVEVLDDALVLTVSAALTFTRLP